MNCVIINNEPISSFIHESILQRAELLNYCGKYNSFNDFFVDLNQDEKDIHLVILTNEMYRSILSDKSLADSFIYSTMTTKYMVLFDRYAVLESNMDTSYKNVHFYNSPVDVDDLPGILNNMFGTVAV